MRKNVLAQYVDLVREVEEVDARIRAIEIEIKRLRDEGEVTDTVKGGYGGTQHFTITGFPTRDYTKKKTLLNTRKASLHSLKSEIEQSINEVQEFINSLEDSRDRRIVTMRVFDRLSWRQIARNMGGGNTEEGVRQIYHRILEKNK